MFFEWIIDDSGPFYYNEDGKPTKFGEFYEEILKNTSLNFLSSKGYNVIDYSVEELTEDKDVSIYKKTITDKNDELLTLLNGLTLSNFQIKNINQEISDEEKKNDNLGIELLGSKIDLTSLIENNKVEVNSYIKLVNKDFPENGDAITLHRSYNYEFIYSIKPKGNYYWKGVDYTNNKNKQALEIRIDDYINDILFIDNLDTFKVNNNTINFTGDIQNLVFGSETIGQNIIDSDQFINKIKTNLGSFVETTNNSDGTFEITSTNDTNLWNVFDLFVQEANEGNQWTTKIEGMDASDTKSFLKSENINVIGLNDAFKKIE